MMDNAGLIRRPQDIKHAPVVTVPQRWDSKKFLDRVKKEGPPPWDGPDDGLPFKDSETHSIEIMEKRLGWTRLSD